MKSYILIWAPNDIELEKAVNKYLAENPKAFLLGGPVAVNVGQPPSPHNGEHYGWYQAAAENT